jgi:hypothetical protein
VSVPAPERPVNVNERIGYGKTCAGEADTVKAIDDPLLLAQKVSMKLLIFNLRDRVVWLVCAFSVFDHIDRKQSRNGVSAAPNFSGTVLENLTLSRHSRPRGRCRSGGTG